MKIKNRLYSASPWILLSCFIAFMGLCWILLFRDIRALMGISNLYKSIEPFLFETQTTLTHYGLNSIPTILFGFVAVISITAYLLSLKSTISLKKTFLFAIAFQMIMFFSYPILSTDIFSYIFSERVSTEHNQNIWKVKPAEFYPEDNFGVLADWKETTSIYGGVHFLTYLIPSILGHNNLLQLVISYKLVSFIFSLATVFLLYKILQFEKTEDIAGKLRMVFWNPLFVLEIMGSGHNDIIMIFFMLLGYYFYRKKLWFYAGTILALAVQVKIIPIILFAFCLLSLLKVRNILNAGKFVGGFLVTNALFFWFMQISVIEYIQRVAFNNTVYWQSLKNISITYFPMLSTLVTAFFAMWLVYFGIKYIREKSTPMDAYVAVVLGYLVFLSSAYWNWYSLWLVAVLPFVTSSKIKKLILVLSFSSLFAYPILWIIQRINTPSPIWSIVVYVLLFGPVLLTAFISINKKLSFVAQPRFALNKLIAGRRRR